MKQKINNALKEQTDRLKKAVERMLNIPAKKAPAYVLQPVRNQHRFPR
ncbi:MAG TPA: hypothetical protein PLU11_00210 [Chitinophagaceae bacterium]|nr:hypothetical protein [Chitinophagaceae bacterium]HPH30871.1 hypothetical protein [Chitinophagaceae bacterium]HPN57552.1 hypothetical protein [Chitinophagaceae bacterium]